MRSEPESSVLDRVGFKSPATISQAQSTAQYDGKAGTLAARGRHDPCVVPRAVPIVESMAAIVVMEYVKSLSLFSACIPFTDPIIPYVANF